MNNRTDHDQLLDDVLAEASPAEFRAALLAETLRRARRRRHFRQARRTAGVLAVLGLLAVLAAQPFSRPPVVSPSLAKKTAKPGCEIVRTRPMPAGAIVGTRRFVAAPFAAPVAGVVVVATTGGGYRLINDNELLALLADTPAVLIRTGPDSEELVFANPEDQKKFW